MTNVFLIGMPGSGKSYWLDRLRTKTGLPAYELDDLIMKSESKSIKEIFENSGEAYFRQLEATVLRTFADNQGCIISCGGGTPCFHNNMQWMNEHGVTVWLDVPAKILLQRLTKQKEQRPLLNGLNEQQLHDYLRNTLHERKKFYHQATYTLHDDEITEHNILNILKEHA